MAGHRSIRETVKPERERLTERLEKGEVIIAQAEARGEDTTKLVDWWIELLHQYERAVDAERQSVTQPEPTGEQETP